VSHAVFPIETDDVAVSPDGVGSNDSG